MNWKAWRMGLLVAGLSGFLTGVVGLGVGLNLKSAGLMLAINAAKDMLLYLAKHPIDGVSDTASKMAGTTLILIAIFWFFQGVS